MNLDQSEHAAGLVRTCGHCQAPMQRVRLAGHYQRPADIDVCLPCSLIWFDEMESVRIAGPGLIALVEIIDGSLKQAPVFRPLPTQLPCQQCGTPLKRVFDQSRYGRTAHLECPHKHGRYQSFMLFLAEKGFVRPYEWHDIQKLVAHGHRIECVQCGAALEARPQSTCSYCASPVGIYDPARFAQAIDKDQTAQALEAQPRPLQLSCKACGSAYDPGRDLACPRCHAVLRPSHTGEALAASQAVADAVSKNYVHQSPAVSRRKLRDIGSSPPPDGGKQPLSVSELGRRITIAVFIGLVVLLWAIRQPSTPDADARPHASGQR